MYGHIATATGWTFVEIDQITLWDVNDLFIYWQDYPPAHVLIAAYLLSNRKHLSTKQVRNSFDELKTSVMLAGGAVKKSLPPMY